MTDQVMIGLTRDATKAKWQEAEQMVADELGVDPDDLARWEVVRELTEAYTGGDCLGEWRDDGN